MDGKISCCLGIKIVSLHISSCTVPRLNNKLQEIYGDPHYFFCKSRRSTHNIDNILGKEYSHDDRSYNSGEDNKRIASAILTKNN